MSRTFGLILAGGEGSRLGGVRKADLRIGGARLLERVAAVFEGEVAEILVASGQEDSLGPHISTRDGDATPLGPLAGIRAAVRYLDARAEPGDLLVSVAVDTPFVPRNYVEQLRNAAVETGASFAAWGQNIYPTNSAWQLGKLRDALEDAGESAGPKAILTKLAAVRVDWSADAAVDPFTNLNTLKDLIALQRRAFGLGI